MADKVILTVGTKRGMFLIESNKRRTDWTVRGPLLKGWTVTYGVVDTRGTPRIHAAASHYTFASNAFSSDMKGTNFKAAKRPPIAPDLNSIALKFSKKYGLDMTKRLWIIEPGPAREKKVMYAGTAPAGLFRSEDLGVSWEPVDTLNKHKTRKNWSPGAGGQCLHSIQVDPHDSSRMYVAISAAGSFRTDDGGKSWKPINLGVHSFEGAPKNSLTSTCVHKVLVHPSAKGVVYQQNHVGVYRSRDYGDSWQRIDKGLPWDFGFGLALNANNPETCYVIPLEPNEYMFRATDGALCVYARNNGGWKALTKGLPGKNAYVSVLRQAMSSDSLDPCGVYFGTAGGHVFASNDEGASWRAIAEFLPPINSVTAAVI